MAFEFLYDVAGNAEIGEHSLACTCLVQTMWELSIPIKGENEEHHGKCTLGDQERLPGKVAFKMSLRRV